MHIRKLFSFFRDSKEQDTATPFSSDTHIAVIRSSICTGEKVAGFRDKRDGSFTEVMLIRSQRDLEQFQRRFGVEHIKTEY